MQAPFTTINLDPHFLPRMSMIADTLAKDENFSKQVSNIMGELTYYSWKDVREEDDPEREAYLTKDPDDKERIKALGIELNMMGGFGLMQFVAEVLRDQVRGSSDVRTLEFAWDGIGEWKC